MFLIFPRVVELVDTVVYQTTSLRSRGSNPLTDYSAALKRAAFYLLLTNGIINPGIIGDAPYHPSP